ncbi:major facilitator superfamily domain-containing protein 6-like [Ruditapes philippinarum]|uniref:major facilitator superfamily domain-containing protein 6-like n=1 Tax=Ruditapes philippinarum TaxID=129788 RepID=UPI00295B97AA|nr:major facilitator superfamily domain-containing protein 6-like [Ruditapes philippinarum]
MDYNSKGVRRDMIDSLLTYVNKDLLICKLFYFFFFAAFGSLYPLLAIYFKQLGMNATQSGILIGFRPFIEFCSAPFWGGIADKVRKWYHLTLFSLLCWIFFTLAMAFVKPPHQACVGNGNMTDTDIINFDKDLIKPAYSTVYYKREDVKDAFFALLLIIVIGEFFSAPAITFADTVTLSYLGDDTDNYGRQRMFGSLGWGLSMLFVGMALDHSSTYPSHPCEFQHSKEKNYVVCFAVFTVLMICALITATQFRFPGQDMGADKSWPSILLVMKDKVTETITGKRKIDREQLVEEDDEFKFGQPRNTLTESDQDETKEPKVNDNGKPLQISLQSKTDMVTDVINSPGTMAPPDPDEPFLGRWVTVLKLLSSMKFISVLFVVWFMGFGIGLIFTFLFWHLQDLGGNPTLFGVASVINHISELLAYFLCSRFIAAYGHINVLYAGLCGNVVRFIYISLLKDPFWVLPFECVQGLTHAAVWATTCSYVMTAIPPGLRSSAQGILQGIHHGLGRGCGAVFGGILVYSFGSKNTFLAYGIACIFVLIGFFGVNWWLKRQGIQMESHVPHETLAEDQQMTFDPHGVPSGLVRDLSSSKLKQADEPVTSYGTTLGTNLRKETPYQTAQTTGKDDDFNPRASEYSQKGNNYGQTDYGSSAKPWSEAEQSYNQYSRRDPQVRSEQRQSVNNEVRPSPNVVADVQQDRRVDETDGYARMEEETEYRSRRTDSESPRRHSVGHGEPKERKERRRRQSGDIEGMREREDYGGYREQRESRRHGDDARGEHRRHGDRDERGHRRHSKKRSSESGQDIDPNPREKIVFEQLPDITSRMQRPSRDQS